MRFKQYKFILQLAIRLVGKSNATGHMYVYRKCGYHMIVLQIKRFLINESVTFTSVSVSLTTLDSTNGTAVTIELALPSTTDTDEVSHLLESYSEQYSSRADNRGSIAVIPSSELDHQPNMP